ncbi:lysozyme inhibitor LprI family protein [Erythrobacter sp. 3-20A1M]|uniref:lysozyme inhibitor LprI family protein n=1 Tax=Erythrobacter sp. 3-20A1M TaxID=2653850 RepID=UPI00203E15B2|nr:lysozyme inhibitor LprI family protein [Erythrobacter sp. 3-20A1M]
MILAALLLVAQPNQPKLDCENPQTQTALTMCSKRDFDRADAAMNAVWKEVRAVAKNADADVRYEDDQAGYWDTLLKAQRAWLTYRDEHCRYASYDVRGGSLQPMLINNCTTDLTNARTMELRELLVSQVSGEPKTVPED